LVFTAQARDICTTGWYRRVVPDEITVRWLQDPLQIHDFWEGGSPATPLPFIFKPQGPPLPWVWGGIRTPPLPAGSRSAGPFVPELRSHGPERRRFQWLRWSGQMPDRPGGQIVGGGVSSTPLIAGVGGGGGIPPDFPVLPPPSALRICSSAEAEESRSGAGPDCRSFGHQKTVLCTTSCQSW